MFNVAPVAGRAAEPKEARSRGHREDERHQRGHQAPPVGDGAGQRQAAAPPAQEGQWRAGARPAAGALHRRSDEVVPDRRHRVAQGQYTAALVMVTLGQGCRDVSVVNDVGS